MSDKPKYAFMLTAVSLYGTIQVQAYICRIGENGEFLNPGYNWPYEDQGYADLFVYQFADGGKPGGTNVEYRDVHSIDAQRLEKMTKTLRTITRGLDKIRNAEGYLTNYGDLPALLFRVARVLKINTFYVRNTREARERSGERWRKADAEGVQYWYAHAIENIGQGKVSAYDC